MKQIETVAGLIATIRAFITEGKKIAFDCDQVLFDKGKWNTTLIDALDAEGIAINIASHSDNASRGNFDYIEIPFDEKYALDDMNNPIIDEYCRPVSAKIISDEYVLVDDRAIEWAGLTGKSNYIQYKWEA